MSRGFPLQKLRPLIILAGILMGGAVLYLARGVLIPLALAFLLTFLIHPIVSLLERLGAGRVVSVTVVVLLLFSLLGGVGWAILVQFSNLSHEIPRYRDNLIEKIAHVRGARKGGALEQAQSAAKEVAQELNKEDEAAKPEASPTPVVVKSEPTGLWQLPFPLEGLGSAGMVLILVIFMLLDREDLRNRLLRLIGYSRLTTTTRALDEAGERISRYLLMQTIINGSFGLGIALGLILIGVPYALLWGVAAAALRFIPYVGPWVAALVLIVFCLAAFKGWQPPLLVVGLFIVLELASNLVLEPLLYGQSAGVSQVALLVSVTFWSWLWGPVGLVLATPLTVCLVVLAKHVPELEFIAVLMADEPPIAPDVTYYHRLLAMDQDEAADIVEEYLKDHPVEAVYDDVILPALNHARDDREQGTLSEADARFIWQATREIVEYVGSERQPAPASVHESEAGGDGSQRAPRRLQVLASPARDEADGLALLMLRQLLDPTRWKIDVTSPHLLASEVVAVVGAEAPAVFCVGGLASGGPAYARYLCKRLRARFPDLPIVVGRWGLRERIGEVRGQLEAAGANYVGTTFVETREQLRVVYGLAPKPVT